MANMTHDLRAALGFDTRPAYDLGTTVLPAVAIFGAGVVLGAGVALMLAPKPGRELREDVVRTANQVGSQIKNRVPALQGDAQEARSNEFHTSTSQPPRM